MMDKTTELYRLSNGIPVVICDRGFRTSKILISLGFGARDESEHEYGITHFIEHLLGQSLDGDTNFAGLKKKIEALGGIINLYTNYSKIGCFVNVIPEHLIEAINIIAPQIMAPVFDAKKIEQERNVILSEYRRSVDNNSWGMFKFEKLFHGTGLGHPTLGTAETIKSFTDKQLSDYYFSHLSCDKCNIVVAGQIANKNLLLSLLESAFGKMPCIPYEHDILSIQPIVAHALKQDMKNVKLALAFVVQKLDSRKAQITLGLFRKILQDRLMAALRYDNGLVYSVQCNTMGPLDTKICVVGTDADTQNIDRIVSIIAATCKDIFISNPITVQELDAAKNVVKFNNAQIIDSIDKSCDLQAQHLLYYNDVYDIDIENHILEEIKISDVMNFGEILLHAPLSVVTQGPKYDCDIIKIWEEIFLS